MNLDSILGVSTIILAIITTAVALGAVLVPGQRAMRQEMGKLGDRMARLEERMARLEGWFADIEHLVVPSITLFEVFKHVRVQRDAAAALYAVAQMMRGRLVDLDAELAVAAAALSAETELAMADSVVLATGSGSRRNAMDARFGLRGDGRGGSTDRRPKRLTARTAPAHELGRRLAEVFGFIGQMGWTKNPPSDRFSPMSSSIIAQREVSRWMRRLRCRPRPVDITHRIPLSSRRDGDELRVMCCPSPSKNAPFRLLFGSSYLASGLSGIKS